MNKNKNTALIKHLGGSKSSTQKFTALNAYVRKEDSQTNEDLKKLEK